MILTEIYPARELPIEGVSSQLIYDNLRPDMQKMLISKDELPEVVRKGNYDVLIVLGAGDVVNYIPQLKQIMEQS